MASKTTKKASASKVSPSAGLYIDPTAYLQGGNLTGNSFAQAAKAANAGNLNMRAFADSALGYALKNPTALDQSGRQALQDYYNNRPQDAVGLKSMQTAMGAGLSERDFLNSLTNFRNNYTFSNFGPQLQDKLKTNSAPSSSSGGGSNPTQAQVAEAQNQQSQWNMAAQGPFEMPTQPKATTLKSAMADGRISKGEINARISEKGFKGKDKNSAYLRIADRWSGKGGALGRGALGNYNKSYEKSGRGVPWLTQFNNTQLGDILGAGLSGKQKSRFDLYNAGKGMLDSKAFRKGDVFARLNDGSIRAERPQATSTQKPAIPTAPSATDSRAPWNQRSTSTPTTSTPTSNNTTTSPASSTQTTATPAGPVPTASLPGYMGPGGDAFSGALKINRAKSRQRRLGVPGGLGTSGLNRSNPFFSVINA